MSSLASAKGPSTTVRLSPENLTRAPFELAWRPLASMSTPAFTISSLNRPISANWSSVGRTPASDSGLALTKSINRMVVSPSFDGPAFSASLYIFVEQHRPGSTYLRQLRKFCARAVGCPDELHSIAPGRGLEGS